MKALHNNGRIYSGALARIFVRNGRATVLSDTEKPKRGRPKKTDDELNKIPDKEEFIEKLLDEKTITKRDKK
jgi:hypothetical protein